MHKAYLKKVIVTTIFLLGLLPTFSGAQAIDLSFLVEKIKIDYPGFNGKITAANFDKLVAASIKRNEGDTLRMMSEIVDYFMDPHLQLIQSKLPIDTIKCKTNLNDILKYFSLQKRLKLYEGFWVNDYNDCVMALKVVKEHPLELRGYVIESRDTTILFPGIICCDFYTNNFPANKKYFTKYLSRYSGNSFFVWSYFKNDSTLITGTNSKWRKISQYKKPIISTLPKYSNFPSIKLLDQNNVVIKIPENTLQNAQILDSLLTTMDSIIRKTPNLIIDVRNNLGGNLGVYYALLPYVYTNPIAEVAGYRYCTKDEIDRDKLSLEKYLKKDSTDSIIVKNWINRINVKEKNIGKLVEAPPDTTVLDSVTFFPKNVGVIINYACLSSTEMMLLGFKQSKKVKIFGEHTAGGVDYLDFYAMDLPSKKYKLRMPTAKRKIPVGGRKLDGIGIYPDIPISDAVPDWINFVKKYYEKH